MSTPRDRSTLGSEFLGEDPALEGLGMTNMVDQIVEHLVGQPGATRQVLRPVHGLVGVFGHWGSGKTHALNLIGKALLSKSSPELPCFACAFRAWEYEAEADIASAFIRCLVSEQNYPWGQSVPVFDRVLPSGATLRQAAWKFADFVFKLGKSSGVPGLGALSEIGQALLDLRESDRALPPEPVADQVRRAMQDLIAKLIPEGGRLYVLVDDLDRCSPPNIVRLFEWFKNHLDTTRCTYVLGLDHRIAAKAIVGHYRDYMTLSNEESTDYGYRYLDKLFEVDFEILPSSMAEKMVLDRLEMHANSITDWTRTFVGRDFGGEPEMKALLGVSALWIPRVLLRTVVTFRMSLAALVRQNAEDRSLFSIDLPSSFPFWLFLLSALHHLFPPDQVETFVRADLRGLQKAKGIGTVLDDTHAYGLTDPRSDFFIVLNTVKTEALVPQQISYLYRTVREKAPRRFRTTGLDR